jgi:Kef-type K+ transport system membrane component KefB
MSGFSWLIFSILLGIVLGWMFHYLISELLSESELLLLTSGTVILSAGLASHLHLSPLFVNFILGVTIANLPSLTRNRASNLLLSTEHPFYIVFLILVGALWSSLTGGILWMAVVYLLFRLLGLSLGVWIGRSLWSEDPLRPPADLGLAMLPQSGVALALVIDYLRIQPGALAELALGVMIIALLLQQLIGPTLLVQVLRRHGELAPRRLLPDRETARHERNG